MLIKLLKEPSQLMTLYIGDVLLANPDRRFQTAAAAGLDRAGVETS
jgi:2-hydroxychromene-2-carboxylate isomerase